MTLSLSTFKQEIDATILGRGRSYYRDGHVLGLEEVDANHWQAEVIGTYPYTVTITVAGDDTLVCDCTCPYDMGPYCKHVAATLYAMEVALDPTAATKPRKKRQTRADKVRSAVETLSHDALVNVLVEIAGENRQVAQMLLARYGPPATGKQAALSLVADALRYGRDRHGFLDYRAANEAARAVYRVLGRADDLLSAGQLDEALLLYQAVLEQVALALMHADDSSGMLGGTAHDAMEGIQTVAGGLSPAGRAALFDYCISEKTAKAVADWDWGWNLLKLAGDLMSTPEQRTTLFAALDRVAERHDEGGWISDYDRSRAAEMKLDIMSMQDNEELVLDFLKDHVELDDIRLRLVEFYLERGELSAARQTAQAWLDLHPTGVWGTRRKFLDSLLTIAEHAGNEAEQIRWLRRLFMIDSDMTTFRRLKSLVGPAAWSDYRPGLLAEAERERGQDSRFGQVFVEEEMWPELLALVRRYPYQVAHWHHDLSRRYPLELGEVYARQAAQTIAHHPTRSHYQQACALLLAMADVDPEGALTMVADWRIKHKQRPALQDELTRAFGPPDS